MAEKRKGVSTVDLVRELAAPLAAELGLTLWDVRFLKEGADWFLRIFIDKPDGVGIEDCENMSRAINPPLDELDPITMAYCLEVSSPGLGRELTRPEHFTTFLGNPIKVKMIRPLEDGRRDLDGDLLSFDGVTLILRTKDGGELVLPKSGIAKVRLDDDDF